MVGIRALVPQPVDRLGATRTGAGRDVRQRHVKGIRRFQDVAAEVRIGRRFLHDACAFDRRSGEEMGIAVRRRDIEATDRIHGRARWNRRVHSKRLAGPRPTGDSAAVQRVDVGRQVADEIVIEPDVVELDGCHRPRRQDHCGTGEVDRHIGNGVSVAIDGAGAVGRQRGVGHAVHPGVIDGAAIRGEELVRHDVVRRDQVQRRESLRGDERVLVRGRTAWKIGRERERLGDAGVRARERVPGPALARHALRLVQHQELHRAVGVRIDLLDRKRVEVGDCAGAPRECPCHRHAGQGPID